MFQGIMDSLFQSFNASISVASFQELSACVFSWIEEHCKPQTLREIVIGVLHQLKTSFTDQFLETCRTANKRPLNLYLATELLGP